MAKGLKTGGRQPGSRNKTTTALKEMILEALDGAGGIKYLKDQAKANPSAFMTLVGKVLPLQVANADDEPFKAAITVEFVNAKPKDT